MDSNRTHSQQGETKQSATATTTSPTTTRLGFNTAPAVLVPSQQQSDKRVALSNSLRSISAPRTKVEWRWSRVQMHGATFGTKVTYVHPLNKVYVVVVDMKTSPSYFLQPEFIPKENRDQTICSNVRGDLKNHWLMIYACLDLSYAERLEMRCMCRVFREVEKIIALDHHRYEMLMPIPTYTWFPHRNYSTLKELMDKLNEEYAALPGILVWEQCTAPELLSVGTKVRAKSVGSGVGQGHGGSAPQPATFKDATVQKVNDDETFDVVFVERRRTRKNVPLNELQIPNVSVADLFFSILFV